MIQKDDKFIFDGPLPTEEEAYEMLLWGLIDAERYEDAQALKEYMEKKKNESNNNETN